ncbi:TPA: hypothetical protein N7D27_000873 [Escherichia coli]|nr:hypothetical protein [Escherichia coli]HCO0195242.1 hypothetical protein [Escherichia coli]
MKQMSLIEMDGFLKGKCIPGDLKVNETNAEYLVRKFGELESKLETALRECRSAGITIDNLEAKCAALAAENAVMLETIEAVRSVADNSSGIAGWHLNGDIATWEEILPEINDIETTSTDAFLAEVRAQAFNDLCSAFVKHANLAGMDDGELVRLKYATDALLHCAEQLRKGGSQ